MDKYKRYIESIVAPLDADAARKNTLRRELWAHLCSLAEEEGQKSGSDDAVLERAIGRLGQAEDIRSTFYESVPRYERWSFQLERRVRRRVDESVFAYARRLLVWPIVFIVSLASISLLLVSSPTSLGSQITTSMVLMTVVLIGMLALWVALWLFYYMLRLSNWERRARKSRENGKPPREIIRILAEGLGIGAISALPFLLIGGIAVYAVLGENNSETFVYRYLAPWSYLFVWSLMSFAWIVIFTRDIQMHRAIPDWPYAGGE